MKFAGWRGLSEAYRLAVEGHSPWRPDEQHPEPVLIPDLEEAEIPAELKNIVRAEGIGALAFIPLIANHKLIGKFMAYHNARHEFSREEVDLARTVAHQLAFAINHKHAEEANARMAAIVEHSDDAI